MPGVMDEGEPAAPGAVRYPGRRGILGLGPSPEALASANPEPPRPKVPYHRWKALGRGVSKLVQGLRRPRTKAAKGVLHLKPKRGPRGSPDRERQPKRRGSSYPRECTRRRWKFATG